MTQQRPFALPAYLVGLTLICIPLCDALMQVYPFRAGDTRWRFGSFGLMSNALMIPLTGVLVIFVVAVTFEHRRVQKIIGGFALLLAAVVACGAGLFALDAVQNSRDVTPAAALAFKVATITAAIKATIGIITFGAFGWAALSRPKAARSSARPTPFLAPPAGRST